MKNKKRNIIVVISIILALIGIVIFSKFISTKPTEEIKQQQEQEKIEKELKDDITSETPVLEDFYNGLLGYKSQRDFTFYDGYIVAFETDKYDDKTLPVYIEPCFTYNEIDPPSTSGFVKMELSGVNLQEFRKLFSELVEERIIKEGKYTFATLVFGQIGNINLDKVDFGKAMYDIDKNGLPMEYLKLYYTGKNVIDFDNPIYKKYNYKQLIVLSNPNEQNDIIKVRIEDNKIRVTDVTAETVEIYYSIDEVNNYLNSVGFKNI